MITARQYAELHDTPYTTVATWLQRELIPGAEKQELPYGGYVWMVPQNAPKPELKPGPKRKTDQVDQADAGDQEKAATEESTPAKPKRRASKRATTKKGLKKMAKKASK